jgi:hypothetical protein
MAEIADEELSDVMPKSIAPIQKEFRDVGYYFDERGYRRFGVIPKKDNDTKVGYTWQHQIYSGQNITTNPYYR